MKTFTKSVCDLQPGDRTLSFEVVRITPYKNGILMLGKLIYDGDICYVFWKDIYHQITLVRSNNCIEAIGESINV